MNRYMARLGVVLVVSVLMITGAALTFPEGRHEDAPRGEPRTTTHDLPPCPGSTCSAPRPRAHAVADTAPVPGAAGANDGLRCRPCG